MRPAHLILHVDLPPSQHQSRARHPILAPLHPSRQPCARYELQGRKSGQGANQNLQRRVVQPTIQGYRVEKIYGILLHERNYSGRFLTGFTGST